jgi:hypothetical protein
MKRGRRKIHSSKSPKLERVLRLFELLFDGNQGRASRALGMSQPNLSRIINGVRPPTDRLIELLAQQPSVNSRWLYDGLGEPLIPVTSGTLPVTTNILPGPPIAHTNLLSGDRHPIANVLENESRYWLKLLPDNPILHANMYHVNPGDLLLVETARDQLDRNDIVLGHLCALSLEKRGADPNDETDSDSDGEQMSFLLGHVLVRGNALRVDPAGHGASQTFSKPKGRRNIQRKGASSTPARQKTKTSFPLKPPNAVVGVVLTLERPGDLLLRRNTESLPAGFDY